MAADDENLVSQITVTGGEEATAQVQSFADKSSAAFNQLDASINKAASNVQKSTDQISRAASDASKGVQQVGAAAQGSKLDAFNKQLGDLQGAISNVTSKFPQLAQAVGRFSQRLAAATAAAGAAGIGLAVAAQRVAKEVDGQSTALEDQTKAQVAANNSALALTTANINLHAEQDKLFQQASTGKITWSQYAQSIRQLNVDFAAQQRVARATADAQDEITQANERLQKQLKDRTAYQGLIDTFGGPLLTSLVSFGRQVEKIRVDATTSFGPAIAGLVDTIAGVVSKNSTAISAFFAQASQKITQLISTNGPAIEKFLTNIGAAAASVFNGLIAAAPGVIDFFNNALVPAIQKVGNFLSGIATAINSVFGTQLTGGSIVLIAILAQMTGSIRLLTTVLKLTGSVGRGAFKILEEGGLLINAVFGTKATAQVIKFGGAVATAGGPFKTFFSLIRTGLPLIGTLITLVGTTLGVSFGAALAIVAALGVALFFIIKNVDWKKFGAAAVTAITDVVNILTSVLGAIRDVAVAIVTGFVSAWKGLNDSANSAVADIVSVWNGLIAFFVTIGTGIVSALGSVWSGIVSAASAAWDAVVVAASTAIAALELVWNLVVQFFSVVATNIGLALATAWNAVLDAATVVIAGVQAAWTGLVAALTVIATNISTAVSGAWTAITANATTAVQFVVDTWNTLATFFGTLSAGVVQVWTDVTTQIGQAFTDLFNAVTNALKPWVDSTKAILQPIVDTIKAIAAATGGGGGTDGAPAFAGGGAVSGPGTGTSDSILAWLSNNEFVMRAKAVRKYGVGFMNAVNSGSLSLEKLRGFSLGGLIDIPRFATGGLVGAAPSSGGGVGGRPFTLNIGEQSFTGLRADQSAIDSMTRYASGKSLRSAGRKPLWYRG